MKLSIKSLGLVVLTVSISVIGCSTLTNVKHDSDYLKTPIDVVRLFNKTYGTARMDEIGPYTTERFRKDRPITVWIAAVWEYLKKIEYENLNFEIVDSKINEDNAEVETLSTIRNQVGEMEQKEIYMLVRKNKRWLIDELYVTEAEIGCN